MRVFELRRCGPGDEARSSGGDGKFLRLGLVLDCVFGFLHG